MDGWQAEWAIDSLDETSRRCFCSLRNSDKRFTHFGKFFTGGQPSREYDAFCRAATIGLTARNKSIPTPIGGRLDASLPMVVYDRIEAMTLHEWINLDTAPQPMFRRFKVATAVVDSLQHVHRMGYIHGAVSTDHVLVRTDEKVVVVGWGNVGSRVYSQLETLGFSVQVVDPFLNKSDSENIPLAPFDAVYEADIVCLHTPLTRIGDHPTEGMFGAQELARLKPGATLINAGRGGVIDNTALLNHLKDRKNLDVVLDVWETEPGINTELFNLVNIGTPHIAGYSFEGRVTGSLMIFDALTKFLSLDSGERQQIRNAVTDKAFGEKDSLNLLSLKQALLATYNIKSDHKNLAEALIGLPASFDQLRKHYPKRREFGHYVTSPTSDMKKSLSALGFLCE